MGFLIKIDGEWKNIQTVYRKVNGAWSAITNSDFNTLWAQNACFYGGLLGGLHSFKIVSGLNVTGETFSCSAIYDGVNVTSAATWYVVSGSAVISLSETPGTYIVASAASASSVIIAASYDYELAQKELTVSYLEGAATRTEEQTVVDESGNTTTTTTTITENEDGSSTTEEVSVITDESGNTIGTVETNIETNSDGSFSGSSTTYDSEGNPTEGTNTSGDADGNVNTQQLEYDESGNTTVTGYEIDTSGNPEGTKDFSGDGINTEYYAFDVTQGFVMDMHFTVDCSNTPAGQNENHHNILTAKRSAPSPWYGFQLRQSNTTKSIVIGTQFATGSNTNTTLQPLSITGNVAEYNLRIIYNPLVSTDSFLCINNVNGNILYRNNGKFPDIEELKYIKVTIGYALDENEQPFRYSDIGVKNFSIRRLSPIADPVINCDGKNISITCSTKDVDIYYRLSQEGSYALYNGPISISADTVVESYAAISGFYPSNTVMEFCKYDTGVSTPVIACDGENVSITCDTSGATIYYRLNQSGNYQIYTEAFTISANTFIESYAQLDEIISATATENCIYNPDHDYYLDYLTFNIISGGTLCWTSAGYGATKTIQYSINGGPWINLTPAAVGMSASIEVSDNDVVRFKGTNTSYATSNTDYMGFSGGTSIFNAEGNIMSLVYGSDFIGQTALTGTYNFCSLFKQSNLISAENLILPATTMTPHCYRALFANNPLLVVAPALPATTLAQSCYRYMFQECSITTAPDLLAPTLVTGCYDGMFNHCNNVNYIRCLATNIDTIDATVSWVELVASAGTFVKEANTEWIRGISGIPTKWVVVDEGIKKPTISCDGLSIELTCGTSGSSIYYRLNEQGEYSIYTTPISISADTICEAYSTLDSLTSEIVSQTCIYDDGIEEPVIYCDGEYVTISCDTPGAYIYYRFDQSGNYTLYETALVISADTTCESYAEINGRQSEVVSASCIYDESLKAPVIECNGIEATIVCHSVGAVVYYKLNYEGNYTLYQSAITLSADTVIQAYSELSGETSNVVTETCVYNPEYYYSQECLTFRALTDGTIVWNSIGSGQAKAIQYSKNHGEWTPITASSATSISVTTGDTVRFIGNNSTYAKDKSNYSGFEGGTASFNIEGNIMSLVYGTNFVGQTALTGTYNFCSLFKLSNCVSAEHLILPTTSLTNYCYRAMFSKCTSLVVAPKLPATTLAQGCYWYMFEECAITSAPELLAPTLVRECYGYMFTGCRSLNYIKCMAISGFNVLSGRTGWVTNVASSGTFVKDSSVTESTWTVGKNGIPTDWLIFNDVDVAMPEITCDGNNVVTISCDTSGATIYYKISGDTNYSTYSSALTISSTTVFNAYSELDGQESRVVTQTCEYISNIPLEASNRDLSKWNYNNTEVTTPYSVNGTDGHSASYAKGTFNFETSFALRQAQPTYLWFQHADQSATVYIDDTLVEKHWGGYVSFFVDVSNYVHAGTNVLKVALKNNEGNNLAPASADFNFNATLGKVKLFTSPCLPSTEYGYDGFHITSDVAASAATIYVKTNVPTGATVVCEIDDGTYHFETSGDSTGQEMIFSATVQNPHLWNGILDPHLYNITMEIYHNGELYHRYQRPYGLRFYEYVIDDTTVLQSGDPYTGFLLNGSPYLLRGVCMHDDITGKANALDDTDYTNTFATIQDLGCNFLRLAHYPHPRETYDWCDRLGIIVETEAPCVNKLHTTMPNDYYEHLNTQYDEMVNQHYNHPCIIFWNLSNETTTDDKEFGKTKIEAYASRIKALDSERMVGIVMAKQSVDPSTYYNNPDLDWFGTNMYQGWYYSTNSNNPTSLLNTHVSAIITNKHKPFAYSEYGAGGTQDCHSDDFMTTTTRGNKERHDIEYQMWIHEGHLAAIRNYPQLLFTSAWQLFDIAVSNRNEGYTVCLDGENASIDDSLRRLNDKGLVERDHITRKDTFYLYKAEWNPTPFVHICGKNYTKTTDRVIKCYTNDGSSLSLSVNGTPVETVSVTDHIATFTARSFSAGDVLTVSGTDANDTLTFS